MSFFEELKRRNVFRVGVAYAVASWLLLQLTEVLSGLLELEADIGKIVIVMLLIGFPVALFFAWAFELTPEGVKRESEVDRSQSIAPQTGKKLNTAILALMALAIAYLLFDKFSGDRPEAASTPAVEIAGNSTQPEAVPAPDIEPAVSRQSIAVLPFDNRSPDANDAYFAEGIHDDLLTNLARISALKVISRTSVTQYKGTTKTIPQIAAELGVAHIMEGAVQRAGDSVRINVQLIDAQTDEHLWAEIFDRDLSAQNLFAIQSEISQAIADALKTTLTSEEQQRINTVPTQNLAAYEAYLRGKQLMASRESKKLEQAVADFETATTLDPEFALAWVGYADSVMLLTSYGTLTMGEIRERVAGYIDRALAIDDQLGEAYASLSQVHMSRRDWEQAEAAHLKSIELSPGYATAYHWYSNDLNDFPLRIDESIEYALKAAELDPNSAIIGANLAASYRAKGLYSMAERQLRKLIEINPQFARGPAALADLLIYQVSRYPEAIQLQRASIEQDPGNIRQYQELMNIYLDIGDLASAQAVRERQAEVDQNHPSNGMSDALYNAFAGNAAGVREAVNWAVPRYQGNPFALSNLAFIQASVGDLQQAKETYLTANPGWLDPNQWERLVSTFSFDACVVAWLLINTGDEKPGHGLLDRTSRYLEEELPAVMEHPDNFWPHFCQLTRGDTEMALTTMETMLAHDHLFAWTVMAQFSLFDSIRDEPRFIAAMQERDRKIALQRAEIEAMQAEGKL